SQPNRSSPPVNSASGSNDDSILNLLEREIGTRARVELHDLESGQAPASSAADLPHGSHAGRYQVLDLLGEGGVGAVHRGRDADLGREVAMKFLHERYRRRPEVLQRFVEEAQIGGQLQHPGIVPVYELGMADGRPFFAMKMVKGMTLSRRLAQRASPESDLGSILAIFEQICQTMAYAHARGVVHRDLKPANVMIGNFGEVQIVDWGMGKVLPRDGKAVAAPHAVGDEAAEAARVSVIETVRSQRDGSQSLDGSVMGTPAYMPREQAIGDVEAMDRRSDVFALGAILCEILTKAPPYTGTPQEMLKAAAFGKVDKAHQRLRGCNAEPPLVELAIRCLQVDPADRPESAAVVADAIHTHLAETAARAQAATLRAMTLKRTQEYGIALTAVIGLGLCGSLWFWRDAERQREVAQEAATAADRARAEEQAAREEAETNLANFNRLSQVVRLQAAKASAMELFPAWPEQVPAMREWQRTRAQPLAEALDGLRATMGKLERRALPESKPEAASADGAPARTPQDDERARRRKSQQAELARMQARLQCWREADAVRRGEAKVAEVDLSTRTLPTVANELNKLAWPLVDPDRTEFGREAEGLQLARRAVALVRDGDRMRPYLLDTLAWACVAVGLFDEAVQHQKAALAAATADERAHFERLWVRLEEQVRRVTIPDFAAVMNNLAKQIDQLQSELDRRDTWAFADDSDTFLHGTLQRLVANVEAFLAQDVVAVERRLEWAERVGPLTIERYKERWQAAREAIAKADGVTASTLYAEVPIDLKPQMGLIPLGMNPSTGLWEFYHLRSAWDRTKQPDPATIDVPSYDALPDRGAKGLDMNHRGIVFVLLPGGSFFMGAQDRDPNQPNFDPDVDEDQWPVTRVTLAPFFLAKHEMTQGQWARLTDGKWPSWYIVGNEFQGIPGPIQDRHPVEQVDWATCHDLMRQH
ncbi:MAG: Serine/threonine-protein kinase PknB, partial [Planctomycetota bacterium]